MMDAEVHNFTYNPCYKTKKKFRESMNSSSSSSFSRTYLILKKSEIGEINA